MKKESWMVIQENEIRDLMQDIGSQSIIEGMITAYKNAISEEKDNLDDAKIYKDKKEIEESKYKIKAFKDNIKMLKKVQLSGEDI